MQEMNSNIHVFISPLGAHIQIEINYMCVCDYMCVYIYV